MSARAEWVSPISPAYWDDAASTRGWRLWDKSGADQLQYYEADLLTCSALRRGTRALETGFGTRGSTMDRARGTRQIVATDLSREVIARARRRLGRTLRSLEFRRSAGLSRSEL